ncbi:tRNA (guanine(37)-N(1))-methyltransferase [Secundilactobacillus paracollinoides]|uniref:tRNA (guanine-N(1)-)-methyltransferase n=1 Tax=Secundilactobacillus paracollinoides TaxID=240427 RepID=A0A1B2J142_9LACO|nr:tRNA (guanosine(37)-N1)-methyltransferase TrmD [Secundilactobacillus paracollinoides]ANZ63794.1 tRNA (guanine(37)-N(1))-methyltransferase [Secundilactobacillus paracollinoides]ANZ68054.1 tRNA (guanine(37)-N(1))-methyltransferase [Secundilactobacillus paracollinoides]KRL76474.1 tRNA (guanine-N(1)-)-methyltransferase [Secundilactobacillus paracollinoides DSM 15502 = JCM 11969]
MRIDVLSLFPNMFSGPLHDSIVGKALERDQLTLEVTDFRQYSTNKHGNVDDYPFGGGAGMLLQAQPLFDAFAATQKTASEAGIPSGRVILMDPAGVPFTQRVAEDFSREDHLTFICGHYEGYDERIRTLVTDEVSMGDYVLTGGELPAMVMIDAITRLLPGVLGNEASAPGDSFSTGLLEYPQYTRPAEFRGMKVPDVLISGDHQKIDDWREAQSLKRTLERRPDLLDKLQLTAKQQHLLRDIQLELDENAD